MSRPVEFDKRKALSAATLVFRRRSYHGVSIKLLEAETGLSSGSIYNSFGGKDAVFESVLRHYNETVVNARIRKHLTSKPSIAGLISLFESLLDEPDDDSYGCLLTNSAVEFGGADNAMHTEIQKGFEHFLTAFKDVVMHLPNANAQLTDTMSLRLLIFYQGLLILIRHGYEKAALKRTIKSEIYAITGELNA